MEERQTAMLAGPTTNIITDITEEKPTILGQWLGLRTCPVAKAVSLVSPTQSGLIGPRGVRMAFRAVRSVVLVSRENVTVAVQAKTAAAWKIIRYSESIW